MSKEVKYHSRTFLNGEKGMAALEIEGNFSEGAKWLDGDVTISDCGRQITLEFYADADGDSTYSNPEKTVEKRLEKLDLLISELQAFRKWYARQSKKLVDKKPVKV